MVVGDVVAGVFNAATALNFQPAAGIEIAITAFGSYAQDVAMTDGTIVALARNGTGYQETPNSKIMINNNIYIISLAASANGSYYSGIQIK